MLVDIAILLFVFIFATYMDASSPLRNIIDSNVLRIKGLAKKKPVQKKASKAAEKKHKKDKAVPEEKKKPPAAKPAAPIPTIGGMVDSPFGNFATQPSPYTALTNPAIAAGGAIPVY